MKYKTSVIVLAFLVFNAAWNFVTDANAAVDTIKVSIPDSISAIPPSIKIPINVTNALVADSITSFDISVSYDPAFIIPLPAENFVNAGSLQSNLNITSKSISGATRDTILISASVIQSGGIKRIISGNGILCEINFTVKTGIIGVSELKIDSVLFNEYTSARLFVIKDNGSMFIGNLQPNFTNIPIPSGSKNGVQDASWTYTFTGMDPDAGDIIRFFKIAGPPSMKMDSITGQLQWRPTAQEVGAPPGGILNQIFQVQVRDDKGLSRIHTDTLRITNRNDPPFFTNPISLPPATEGQNYQSTYPAIFNGADPDADPFSFSFISMTPPPSPISIFSLVGATFSWTPVLQDRGLHTITMRIQDQTGLFSDSVFTINVRGTNGPASITSTPPTTHTIGNEETQWNIPPFVNIMQGQPFSFPVPPVIITDKDVPYVYDFKAIDPDGDAIYPQFSGVPWLLLSNDAQGVWHIGGTPTVAGTVNARLLLVDNDGSKQSTEQLWAITVTGQPKWNQGALVYSATGLPAGATFNLASKTFNWPAPLVGNYPITFTITDGGGKSISKQLQLNVQSQVPVVGRDTIPPLITNVQVLNITGNSAQITWNTNEPSSGFVDFGLTTAYGQNILAPLGWTVTKSVNLINLLPNTEYNFRVGAADSVGNGPVRSVNFTFRTIGGPVTGRDTIPPVITNVQFTNITSNSARITWNTNEPSSGFVEFGLTTAYGQQLDAPPPLSVSKTVDLAGLLPGSEYHFRVGAADSSANPARSNDVFFRTIGGPVIGRDTIPPIITNVQFINITSNSARITWNTNEPSSGFVEFGLTTAYGQRLDAPPPLSVSKTVDLAGLLPGSEYHFRVGAADSSNNGPVRTNDFVFRTIGGPVIGRDTIPPVISNVQFINITSNSARITWNTNELSNGFVEFGFTTAYGQRLDAPPPLSVLKTVDLLNLLPNTEYHFRVGAADSSANPARSNDFFFRTIGGPVIGRDTIPPIITNVQFINITSNSARITWNTNEPSSGFVEFGFTTAYGQRLDAPPPLSVLKTVDLLNLLPNTEYHFRVGAVDSSANPARSNDVVFRTVAPINFPPVPTALSDQNIPQGIPYSRDASTKDPNGDPITYSLIAPPSGMTINPAAGLIVWPAPVTGTFSIVIEFRDDKAAASRDTFLLTIGPPPNRPPIPTALSDQIIPAGKFYSREASTKDLDGDPVTYAIFTSAPGMTINTVTGLIAWLNPVQGTFPVSIEFRDNKAAASRDTFLLTVTAPLNRPPIISAMPDTIFANEGTPLSVPIRATDPDSGQVLKYILIMNPPGMEINPSTGVINWLKPVPPRFEVIARVEDGFGGVAQVRFIVVVRSVNLPPIIEFLPDTVFVIAGQPVNAQINARDPNPGDILTFRFVSGPPDAIISPVSGIVNWPNPKSGNYPITVEVSDGKGGITRRSFLVRVLAPKPKVAGVSPAQGPNDVPVPVSLFGDFFEPGVNAFIGTIALQNPVRSNPQNINGIIPPGLNQGIYDVIVRNPDGQTDTLRGGYQVKTPPRDSLPPIIFQGPDVAGITQTSANISWSTDEPSNSFVQFGTDSLNTSQIPDSLILVQRHQVTLSGLLPGTRYWFRVGNRDKAGNGPSFSMFKNFSTVLAADTKPPKVLSGPTILGVMQDKAVIGWETDEPATSGVGYRRIGSTDTTTQRIFIPNLDLKHIIEIRGLFSLTEYEYSVFSRDAAGNEGNQFGGRFITRATPDTMPPILVKIPVALGITDKSASIEWETNEPSTGFVELGTTPTYGTINGDSTLTFVHRVFLSNLLSPQTYYFRIKSADGSGNMLFDIQRSFRTLAAADTTPPRITRTPGAESVTDSTARITWETDKISNSRVTFGTDSLNLSELRDPTPTQRHSLFLSGLIPNTFYYFKIFSTDPSGNVLQGKLRNFRTALTADKTPPVFVQAPFVEGIATNGAVIKWKTNELSSSFILYDSPRDTLPALNMGKPDLVIDHSIAVTGLASGMDYIFKVYSTDGSGNTAGDSSATNSFRTPQVRDTDPPRLTVMPHPVGITENSAIIEWETNETADGQVKFGFTSQYELQAFDPNISTKHSVLLKGLASDSTYHYSVISTDPSNNVFTGKDLTFRTLAAKDITPPRIVEGPIVQGVTQNSAFIQWKTSEISSAEIDYRTVGGTEFISITDASLSIQHGMSLTGLQSNSDYEYQIVTTDASGNDTTFTNNSYRFRTIEIRDTIPPIRLSGPAVVGITDNSASIEWTTDKISSSFISFGLDTPLVQKVGDPSLLVRHSVTLSNLLSGMIYKYRIYSEDASRNVMIGPLRDFQTKSVADIVPPIILEGPMAKGISTNSVSIVWRTDENSSSFVNIRRTGTSVFQTSGTGELVSNHLVPVFGLEVNTAYDYQVSSSDAQGNERKSSIFSFTTLAERDTTPPVIVTGPFVSSRTEGSATIEWNTNELSDSYVNYGDSVSLGLTQADPTYTNNHKVVITNLKPNTTYRYLVGSRDMNRNGVESALFNFTTRAAADINPPVVLKGPVVIGKTDSRAAISWFTDKPSNSRVSFGISATYIDFKEEPRLTKEHVVDLTGLTPGQEYHYQISSADQFDNKFISGDFVFKTSEQKDNVPPVILSGPMVLSVSENSATIEWQTNEPSNSQIDFGSQESLPQPLSVVDGSNVTKHTIVLTGLSPATLFYYRVRSKDPENNEQVSKVLSFRTLDVKDEVPPILVAGPVEVGKTEKQVTIRWTTDELSDGFVEFGSTSNYGDMVGDPNRSIEHLVQITNLSPGTVYHYRLISSDPSRNTFRSGDFSFTTNKAEDKVPPVLVNAPNVVNRQVTSAAIEWVTDEISSTKLYYGLTQSLNEVIEFADYVTKHRVDLTNLNADTLYYFRIESIDPSSNTLTGTLLLFRTKAVEDVSPPRWIARPFDRTRTSTTVSLWWKTDKPADGLIEFGEQSGNLDKTIQRGERKNEHEILITQLKPNTDYFYRVTTTAMNGLSTVSEVKSCKTLAEQDTTPPLILKGPNTGNVSYNTATIEWETNKTASSFVDYGTSPDSFSTTGSADFDMMHKVVLTNLLPDKLYYYVVSSADLNRNEVNTKGRDNRFYTKAAKDERPPDIVEGPVISNLNESSVTIAWRTDELSNSFIEFGQDTSYTEGPVGDAENVSRHNITVRNLRPDAEFFAYVRSSDISGNTRITRDRPLQFRTLAVKDTIPPYLIRGPIITQVTTTTASIEWEMDKLSDGFIAYNTKRGNELGATLTEGTSELTLLHRFVLSNLFPGTNYEYLIRSNDINGNQTETTRRKYQFQTHGVKDTIPPVITAGPIVYATERSASFEWETDEPSDSFIYFKVDSPEVRPEKIGDAEPVQKHSVVVTNLDSSKEFIFIITSRDMAGNIVTFPSPVPAGFGSLYKTLNVAMTNQPPGGDGRFRTSRRTDTQSPVIVSGPVVTSKTASTVTLTWKTDELSDSQIQYGASESYGLNKNIAEKSTEHTVTLTNLSKATSYNYRIGSSDINLNGPSYSGNSVVTTPSEDDVTPPSISKGPVIATLTNDQVTILWETNEPANSFVDYSLDKRFFKSDTIARQTRSLSEYSIDHKITLTNLTPGQKYYYRVKSYDINNNGPSAGPDTFVVTELKPDTSKPGIVSGPTVTSKTDSQSTITWTTNKLSNSFVKFDTTAKVQKRIAMLKAGQQLAGPLFDNNVGSIQYSYEHVITLTNLTPNTSYSFVVGSLDQFRNESEIPAVQAFQTASEPDTIPPEQPANFQALPGDRVAYLKWDAIPNASGDLSGYNIYRIDNGEWKPIVTNHEGTSYYDYGLTNGLYYSYQVTAIDKVVPNNESQASSISTVTPDTAMVPSSPITDFPISGMTVTTSRVSLSVRNASGMRSPRTYTFAVARDSLFLDIVMFKTKVPEGDSITSCTITEDIDNKTIYYWRVRPNDGVFDGSWSKTSTFMTDYPTSVEFVTFEAKMAESRVRLFWKTSNEDNNAGFNVWRSLIENDDYRQINQDLISVRLDHSYSFEDENVQVGQTYYYRLESVSLNGKYDIYESVKVTVISPHTFVLHQNYPNPFNPVTNIKFELPVATKVTIKIYNILGQEIKTLANQPFQAGYHIVQWDGRNNTGLKVASGVYIYRMQAGKFVKSQKMLLLK